MAQRLEVPLKYAFIQVYLINGGCNLDSLSGNALIFNRINWSRRIVSRFFSRPLSASGGGPGFLPLGMEQRPSKTLPLHITTSAAMEAAMEAVFSIRTAWAIISPSNFAKICTFPEWIIFPGFSNSYLKGFQSWHREKFCTAFSPLETCNDAIKFFPGFMIVGAIPFSVYQENKLRRNEHI